MVARSAGGREVAGSNPVTPIPWQGHGRRSDPSGGLRKRETFNNLGESYVEYDCSFMGVFASDIIRLSDINEKFGYMAGNARLRMVADVIRGVFTGYDIYLSLIHI
mgnify:CR=1 FL=1